MATSRPQKRPRSSLVDIGEVTWLAAKDVAQRVSPEEDEQGRSKLEDTDVEISFGLFRLISTSADNIGFES